MEFFKDMCEKSESKDVYLPYHIAALQGIVANLEPVFGRPEGDPSRAPFLRTGGPTQAAAASPLIAVCTTTDPPAHPQQGAHSLLDDTLGIKPNNPCRTRSLFADVSISSGHF